MIDDPKEEEDAFWREKSAEKAWSRFWGGVLILMILYFGIVLTSQFFELTVLNVF